MRNQMMQAVCLFYVLALVTMAVLLGVHFNVLVLLMALILFAAVGALIWTNGSIARSERSR